MSARPLINVIIPRGMLSGDSAIWTSSSLMTVPPPERRDLKFQSARELDVNSREHPPTCSRIQDLKCIKHVESSGSH